MFCVLPLKSGSIFHQIRREIHRIICVKLRQGKRDFYRAQTRSDSLKIDKIWYNDKIRSEIMTKWME